MDTLPLIGIAVSIAAAILLVKPDVCIEFGRKNFSSTNFQYGTGVAGLVLAVAVYYSSSTSKFPTLFEFVALFSLIGGVICLVLPSNRFRNLVSWELKTLSLYGRLLGICYALIGGFLIFAGT